MGAVSFGFDGDKPMEISDARELTPDCWHLTELFGVF